LWGYLRRNIYIITDKKRAKSANKNCKNRPEFVSTVVRIPDNPRKHLLASICFQPDFFDKKSPDSLWNLGLSDLHLLRSEKVAGTRVLVFASKKREFFAEPLCRFRRDSVLRFFVRVILSEAEIRAKRGSNGAKRRLGARTKKFDSHTLAQNDTKAAREARRRQTRKYSVRRQRMLYTIPPRYPINTRRAP